MIDGKEAIMSIELTAEQSQAVEQAGGSPASVFDPQTNKTYILLPAAVYEELKALLAEEQAEQKVLLDRARKFRLGWIQENPY
jgi:hypothetical protein